MVVRATWEAGGPAGFCLTGALVGLTVAGLRLVGRRCAVVVLDESGISAPRQARTIRWGEVSCIVVVRRDGSIGEDCELVVYSEEQDALRVWLKLADRSAHEIAELLEAISGRAVLERRR